MADPLRDPLQAEDGATVNAITAIVREADELFQRVGGSSRHWVRDCFLPILNSLGFRIVCDGVTLDRAAAPSAPPIETAELTALREATVTLDALDVHTPQRFSAALDVVLAARRYVAALSAQGPRS